MSDYAKKNTTIAVSLATRRALVFLAGLQGMSMKDLVARLIQAELDKLDSEGLLRQWEGIRSSLAKENE